MTAPTTGPTAPTTGPTGTRSTLTDRYVAATLREVPEAGRADLGPELRSSIADMVEARVEAGEPVDHAERAVLTELGEPGVLAARYTGRRLQLLGPRFFLVWRRLTLQLLSWVPALVGLLVGGAAVLEGGRTVGEVVVAAGGAAVGTAPQLVFWTTLVFALLDRVVADEPEAAARWTPDSLPEDPVEREYPFREAVAGIAFDLVVAAALVLQHFRSGVTGTDGDDVAVLDPDLWSLWLPLLLVVTAASIALEVWKHRSGWSVGTLVATAVTSVAFSGAVVWLATEDRLLNPELVATVGLSTAGVDRLNLAIATGAVLVAVWEVLEALVRWARSRAAQTVVPGASREPGGSGTETRLS